MKHMIKLPVMLMGLMLFFAGTTQKAMAQYEDVSLQSFYDELSPYGQWIQDPQYGYVWRPDVDQEEFRPYYTNGRWAMTEYGNTWVSNYDWGWAPFHYGRWVYNRYNNWVWIPDTVWGPAWVTWRSGGGYYGWAPLGPNISIGINIGRSGYRVPDIYWNFVPYANIYVNNYPRYYSGRNRVYIQNTVIINNTYVRNNRTYYTGPRVDDIRRATNQNVTVYNLNRGSRPGASRIEHNSVNIYNPRPSRGSVVDNRNAAPRNVVQGNINRGTIEGRNSGSVARDNSMNRPERNSRMDDVYQNNRNTVNDRTVNGSAATRPTRNGGYVPTNDNSNGNMSTRPTREGGVVINSDNLNRNNTNGQRETAKPNAMSSGGALNRDIQRTNQDRQMSRGQMSERSRENNVQPQQQRMERPQATPQRVERQQQAPQRMERQQSSPQRVERSQPTPQRSSGGGESRGNSGGRSEGGRPSRGGN
jgi:hypothetical protein